MENVKELGSWEGSRKDIKLFCLDYLSYVQDGRIGTKRSSQDLCLIYADDAGFVATTRARTQAEAKPLGSDRSPSAMFY